MKILKHPDTFLRQPTEEVEFPLSEENSIIIDNMIKLSNENFCLSFFFKKADLKAITKSSLPEAIFFSIQIA